MNPDLYQRLYRQARAVVSHADNPFAALPAWCRKVNDPCNRANRFEVSRDLAGNRAKWHRENGNPGLASAWRTARQNLGKRMRENRRLCEQRQVKPTIVTARQLGLSFQYLWGSKGSLVRGTGHYDAAPRVASPAATVTRARQIHAWHSGTGGGAYEAVIGPGIVVFLNPMNRKSAAVAAMNTGMANICVPGTVGDRMDDLTKRTLDWLIANWHTSAVPAEHRLPRPASAIPWRGHKEWPGQGTQCPDLYLFDYRGAW